MFEIAKNVPIPPKALGRKKKYPWAGMDVGDSFWSDKVVLSMVSAAASYGNRHKMKFVCRAENSGTRVWRTK